VSVAILEDVNPARWPSLADQVAAADTLFGERGYRLVEEWLATEVARVDNPNFARLFTEHIKLPGIAARDFTHRRVHSARGDLIGGIRFYGRDTSRPFVEVICHSFEDLNELCDCVRSEWSMFAPQFLRLHAKPGRIAGPNVVLDNSIHAARCRDMSPPDGRVTLESFGDADEAIGLVSSRYERLCADDPQLARNLSQAPADDIRLWHAAGQLHAIHVRGEVIGLLAVAAGRVGWIGGYEINEEVIHADHNGNGC
jgi:hypothetical protein